MKFKDQVSTVLTFTLNDRETTVNLSAHEETVAEQEFLRFLGDSRMGNIVLVTTRCYKVTDWTVIP